ncbi:MAG: hypothetical protein ACRDV9_12260 [Acidimicrobiia bacterium]
MRRYLVVANQTLRLPPLHAQVRKLLAPGPCEFAVVVPWSCMVDKNTSAEAAEVAASERLDDALERWRAWGATAAGELTGTSPIVAIGDALRRAPFDAIILSTLPPGTSRLVTPDAPRRIERAYGVPVISVVAYPTTVDIDGEGTHADRDDLSRSARDEHLRPTRQGLPGS